MPIEPSDHKNSHLTSPGNANLPIGPNAAAGTRISGFAPIPTPPITNTPSSPSSSLTKKYTPDPFESRREQLTKELAKDGIKGKALERLLEYRDVNARQTVLYQL